MTPYRCLLVTRLKEFWRLQRRLWFNVLEVRVMALLVQFGRRDSRKFVWNSFPVWTVFLLFFFIFYFLYLPFVEVSNPQIREKLLESKLEQCLLICPFEAVNLDSGSAYSSTDVLGGSSAFNSPNAPSNFISPLDLRNQEIKRQCLVELIELISCGHRPIPDALYPNFFKMVHCVCCGVLF